MKNKIALGLLVLGILAVATPRVTAQEVSYDDIMEKLESIEAAQQEILAKIDAVAAAQEEQKAAVEEIGRKQKSYVNPKWTP